MKKEFEAIWNSNLHNNPFLMGLHYIDLIKAKALAAEIFIAGMKCERERMSFIDDFKICPLCHAPESMLNYLQKDENTDIECGNCGHIWRD